MTALISRFAPENITLTSETPLAPKMLHARRINILYLFSAQRNGARRQARLARKPRSNNGARRTQASYSAPIVSGAARWRATTQANIMTNVLS